MNEEHVRLMDLPTTVRGFCYHDDDGEEFIILNSRLTLEQNIKTLKHEQEHLERGDMYNESYNEYEEGLP